MLTYSSEFIQGRNILEILVIIKSGHRDRQQRGDVAVHIDHSIIWLRAQNKLGQVKTRTGRGKQTIQIGQNLRRLWQSDQRLIRYDLFDAIWLFSACRGRRLLMLYAKQFINIVRIVSFEVDQGNQILLVQVDYFHVEMRPRFDCHWTEVQARQSEAETFFGELKGFELNVRTVAARLEILQRLGAHRYDLDRLFVFGLAFAARFLVVAQLEADHQKVGEIRGKSL